MNQHEIDDTLRTRLDEIKPVPPRREEQRRIGRARFLNEALSMEGTVSAQKFLRHRSWISIGKEKLLMNTVVTMIVIAGLLFGGGATVNAAQDALPGQPLYALKTTSEDFSLQIENDPEQKVIRLMELAQTRTQEMIALSENGQVPPEAVVTRLEQHIREALQTCTSMDDAALDRILLQVRDQLRQQDRDMDQTQLHVDPETQLLLEQTRSMLQTRLRLVEDGLLNHEQFRNAIRNGQEDDLTPPAPNNKQNSEQNQNQSQEQNGEQLGQPTSAPGGTSIEPGGPNTDPGGPNADATPGPNNDNGSGNGNGTEDGSGGAGTGGTDSGGTNSSGNGTGGGGSGGNKP